ncbi:isochorismatase family protein [Tsukamurella asaccharolytica]|uniref:Isochorismatase family protein n=1 Tax=Tsukamurella asaccharolytica TaxID=2592067 RepID=A0A5C5R495_9ACTN|nr:isochorismatase family protein [Tsukamurella asaccharolytica]TWS17849.1 isochorismatase family protein [Tsukamurella asaccharolytica]
MNALLVIDVQKSFLARGSWSEVSNPDIADDVNRLVAAARARRDPVIWVLHAEPGSGGPFDLDSGLVTLQEGLAPSDGEPVLTKTSRNAFTTTRLGQILQASGVRAVTIAGIQTEQCCETTARVAADLGYDVTFVTEATATFPIVRPDTGAVLPAPAVIERTEFALAGRFATIATLNDVA